MVLNAVSVDGPADLKTARAKAHAQFTFLSDSDGALIDRFNIRDKGGNPNGGDVARSAMFLLDAQGNIIWSHQTPNYRVRPDAAWVLEQVNQALAR